MGQLSNQRVISRAIEALLCLAIALLAFASMGGCWLISGCAVRHVQTVPGCDLSRVTAPKGCELVRYPDRVETHCPTTVIAGGKVRNAENILVYRCKTNQEKGEK